MLELVDVDLDTDTSDLAPWERAELYRQMQGRLKFEISKKRETVRISVCFSFLRLYFKFIVKKRDTAASLC